MLNEFIEYIIEKKKIENPELQSIVDNAKYWDFEIIIISYLLSKNFEIRKKRNKENSEQIIDELFNFQNTMYVTFQEFDYDFINFMYSNIRQNEYSLEEELLNIQEKLKERFYV